MDKPDKLNSMQRYQIRTKSQDMQSILDGVYGSLSVKNLEMTRDLYFGMLKTHTEMTNACKMCNNDPLYKLHLQIDDIIGHVIERAFDNRLEEFTARAQINACWAHKLPPSEPLLNDSI